MHQSFPSTKASVPRIWTSFYAHKETIKKIFRLATSPFRRLPDFYIIGAAKAGTTSLHEYLLNHPQIDANFQKETRFLFGSVGRSLRPLFYRSFYPLKSLFGSRRWCFDADPTHSLVPSFSASALHVMTPKAKIILVYRDPVERAWSGYRFLSKLRGHNVAQMTFIERFNDAVEKLSSIQAREAKVLGSKLQAQGPGSAWTFQGLWGLRGMGPLPRAYVENVFGSAPAASGHYAEICEEFAASFGRDNLLVLSFEELCYNTESLVRRVFTFIGADEMVPLPDLGKSMPEDGDLVVVDKNATRATEDLSTDDRHVLEAYFEPMDQRFATYLGVTPNTFWGRSLSVPP